MPYIDPKEVERVKRIDLLTYLQHYEPDELIKTGSGSYCTRTHDSLKLSNGRWYWWSQGFGGKSALDYLIKVKKMAFLDAVAALGAKEFYAPSTTRSKDSQPAPQAKQFILPTPAKTAADAIAYLKLRGIDPHVIKHVMENNLAYQTQRYGRSYVVFTGRDKSGIVRYAALRGIGHDFKGEAEGSDKHFSFKCNSQVQASTVHVFESAIDTLAFATLTIMDGHKWRNLNLLSLGGVPKIANSNERSHIPQALAQYLLDNPHTRQIHLHLDNDKPGIAAADAIVSALHLQGFDILVTPPPKGKDVAEYLMMRLRPCPQPEQVTLNKTGLLVAERKAKKIKREQQKER